MIFLRKIYYFPLLVLGKSQHIFHYLRFLCSYSGAISHLKIGKNNLFPVCVSRRYMRGSLFIGDNNCFGFSPAGKFGNGEILLQPRTRESVLRIGNHCRFSNSVSIICCCNIEIGDHLLCGDGVSIIDSDFHGTSPDRICRESNCAPVKIGNNVWIGSRSLILKGVSIGDNAVIGAMSLVTRDVPANTVVGGNPAKILREI